MLFTSAKVNLRSSILGRSQPDSLGSRQRKSVPDVEITAGEPTAGLGSWSSTGTGRWTHADFAMDGLRGWCVPHLARRRRGFLRGRGPTHASQVRVVDRRASETASARAAEAVRPTPLNGWPTFYDTGMEHIARSHPSSGCRSTPRRPPEPSRTSSTSASRSAPRDCRPRAPRAAGSADRATVQRLGAGDRLSGTC